MATTGIESLRDLAQAIVANGGLGCEQETLYAKVLPILAQQLAASGVSVAAWDRRARPASRHYVASRQLTGAVANARPICPAAPRKRSRPSHKRESEGTWPNRMRIELAPCRLAVMRA